MILRLGFSVLVLFSQSVNTQALQGSKKYLAEMSGPPFWMSAYEEFKNFRKEQKDFYLKSLKANYKRIPDLINVTDKSWEVAIEDKKAWDDLRRKLYVACQNPGFNKVCRQIAENRIEAINLYQNQSEKNLKALQREKWHP